MTVRARVTILSLFVATTIFAQQNAQISGTWSGTLNVTDRCNNMPKPWSSPITLFILQAPDGFIGNVLLSSVPDFSEQCAITETFPLVLPLSGRVSGNTMTGIVAIPDGALSFSATVNGSSMSLTLSASDFSGTATLTQTSTQRPVSDLTGGYSGTYNISERVDNCNNVNSISYSGPISGTARQTGNLLTGILTFTNTKHYVRDASGNCTIQADEDFIAHISGQINGSMISGLLFGEEQGQGDGDFFAFTGTVSANSISITAADSEGQVSITVTKSTAPPPTVTSFTANPATITAGQITTLSWQTQNASGVAIDNGIGNRTSTGSVVVRPLVTTTYTLTAKGLGGSTEASVTVTVSARPRVVLSSFPRGFVQRAGEGGGTDRFSLSNVGEAPTTVTLSPTGGFFTIDANSFDLAPGAHRIVIITGLPQPAGPYLGSIAFSGNGVLADEVRVQMLSAAPPSGTVRPRARVGRAEITSNAGEIATGTIEFTNTGTAPLQAVAVADVPWITPQSGTITIPAGQTVAVSFTVDSSKRPDRDAPLGSVTGKISLVYIGDSGVPILAADTPSSSSISVTLVYMVKPGVTAGTPPPLTTGELALFVPGLGNRATSTGDLILANSVNPTALAALQLYLQGGGAPSQITTISQLLPNASVVLPSLVKNVYGTSVPSGTAQLRGSDVAKASVAAVQSNTSSPAGTYSTALPVFRSDRGVGTNGVILLSGLEQSTELFVQEVSGNAATFRIDFLSGEGQTISSRTSDSVSAFGFAELLNVVPAGTLSARITNTSATGSLAAYALVANATTGDRWLVTDPAPGTTDETFIVPIFSAGQGATTTLYTTNRSNTAVTVTIDVPSTLLKRRRAISRGMAAPPLSKSADAATTIAPSATTSTIITATGGYARISGPAGAISAVARSVQSGGFGSGLPAVPLSAALQLGQARRFAGVDDASTASRTGAVPATFLTSLALVETNNQFATVRVTLQFAFSGGSLVSSSAKVSKEYPLSPGQFLLVTDLARDIVGTNRDSFSDLRDMLVDVEVMSGSGRVIPFVQSIDNGSGDMIVRIE